MEVLETLFSIQRQWMYLDVSFFFLYIGSSAATTISSADFVFFQNIFTGEDIRKQLPGETGTFDQITSVWRDIIGLMKTDLNAKVATHHPGMFRHIQNILFLTHSPKY